MLSARRVLVCLLPLVGVAFAALPGGTALADTTVGQARGQLDETFSAVCSGVLADTNYTVPAGGGLINSFSVQNGPGLAGTQALFLVLRPQGGGNYEVVARGPAVTLGGTATTFPANAPALAGDILGVSLSPSSSNPNFCVRFADSGPGGVVLSDDPNASADLGETLPLTPAGLHLDLNEAANLVTDGSGAPPPPTSKEQCKNGGWRGFAQFKSQGDCVSFVATGGKNPASGS